MSRAFRIDLSGAQEVPPNATTATGLGVAVFDDSGVNPTLDYTIVTRGVDWGPFMGLPTQTVALPDNVNNAHFHAAAVGILGGVVFDWKLHDGDDFTASNLHLDGAAMPIATVHGTWETTDPVNLNTFAASFTSPPNLGDATNIYANVHTVLIQGG